jgi:hypothetical protein
VHPQTDKPANTTRDATVPSIETKPFMGSNDIGLRNRSQPRTERTCTPLPYVFCLVTRARRTFQRAFLFLERAAGTFPRTFLALKHATQKRGQQRRNRDTYQFRRGTETGKGIRRGHSPFPGNSKGTLTFSEEQNRDADGFLKDTGVMRRDFADWGVIRPQINLIPSRNKLVLS